ncbi:MAG TPA: hypothetical protein VFX51_15435 [Solirubrobacteraceae bacterium]|nr:hypothetical protein [Solirubrobacteraceae bacterium]
MPLLPLRLAGVDRLREVLLRFEPLLDARVVVLRLEPLLDERVVLRVDVGFRVDADLAPVDFFAGEVLRRLDGFAELLDLFAPLDCVLPAIVKIPLFAFRPSPSAYPNELARTHCAKTCSGLGVGLRAG